MIEESLLKTHFLGRDGFRWWIGQIPPLTAEMTQQVSGSGWGNRYPVRIMGYHPYSQEELPDKDLPWAHVILPPGVPNGGAGLSETVKFTPGDVVTGFFLDGDNAQQPVIFGTFGRSKYQANNKEKLPFTAFSGYNDYIKKPAGVVQKSEGAESNESNAASSPTPRSLGTEKAKKYTDNASLSPSIGKIISLPVGNNCNQQALNKAKTAIEQFIFDFKNKLAEVDMGIDYSKEWIQKEIQKRSEQISKILSGYVAGIMNKAYEKMIPLLNDALKSLYNFIKDKLGELIAVNVMSLMVPIVKKIQNQLACLTNQIISELVGTAADILTSVSDNVLNFVDCVADQVIGGFTNNIFDKILDGLNPLFDALNAVQAAGEIFKLFDFFKGGKFDFEADILRKIDDDGGTAADGLYDLFECNQPSQSDKYGAAEYRIGSGPVMKKTVDLSKIIKDANAAKAVSLVAGGTIDDIATLYGAFTAFTKDISVPDLSSVFGECYAGIPQSCGPTVVNIFGGGGSGATAEPIFGYNTVGSNGKTTGSIIGFKLTNPGQNYKFPPFVDIVDNCNQGYGAKAVAIVKPDGTLDKIVPKNEKTIGENYPSNEDPEDEKQVVDTEIIEPGSGYQPGDTITDNLGNQYKPVIENGGIVKATPINSPKVTEIPIITPISDTGSGAIIMPIIDNIDPIVSGDVQSVIDCIT